MDGSGSRGMVSDEEKCARPDAARDPSTESACGRGLTLICPNSGNAKETSTFSDSMEGHTTNTKTYENMNAYQCEINSMVESVLNGTEPVISLVDSWNHVATIVALHESARTGKPVQPATQSDKLA